MLRHKSMQLLLVALVCCSVFILWTTIQMKNVSLGWFHSSMSSKYEIAEPHAPYGMEPAWRAVTHSSKSSTPEPKTPAERDKPRLLYSASSYLENIDMKSFTEMTSIYVDLDKIKTRLKAKMECQDIVNRPRYYWKSRPNPESLFTSLEDSRRIFKAARCGGLLIDEFLRSQPTARVYPFEVAYFSTPPVWNRDLISNTKFSWIKMLNTSTNYSIGDTVAFRVDVLDGRKQHKTRGGDRIKVLLSGLGEKHSIAAQVTDFDNGTYLATTVLPWAGTIRVEASLTYPREYFRAIFYTHRVLKSFKIHLGGYNNSKASEGVPCSPFPLIPGHGKAELCNLTEMNGSPWFCGRPVKPQLNCSHFSDVMYNARFLDPLITDVELKLLQRGSSHKNLPGSNNISLQVDAGNLKSYTNGSAAVQTAQRLSDPSIACHKVPPRVTWNQRIPTGYFYKNKWQSFICQISSAPIDSGRCFKNVQILVLGDSNQRMHYLWLNKASKCNATIVAKWKKWHGVLACENVQDNFTMWYIPHSSPFNTGNGAWTEYKQLKATVHVLDQIPATGRYLVTFNHYLHFMTYHISAYEDKLWPIIDALKRLFARNSQAHVLLRAPHISEFGTTYPRGDNLGMLLYDIQRRVFSDLQDRLLYLPTWDLTIAARDTDPHPKYNSQIFTVMASLLCDRGL